MPRSVLVAVLVLVFCLPTFLIAQSGPTVYSYIASNKFVGDMVVHAQRDGTRAVVQLTSAVDPKRLNVKNFYDFGEHRVYTLDLNSNICTTVAYTSPYAPPLNDVAAMANDLKKQLADSHATSQPGETIAGQPTKLYEVTAEGMTVRVWVEDKYGIPMRYIMTPKGGTPSTVVEISSIQFRAALPAAFPRDCKQLKGSTDANGGHVEE